MSPGGARYSLTSRLAVAAMAGYGLAWLRGCGRRLPVRLPGISLATLTSGRPGSYWHRFLLRLTIFNGGGYWV